MSNKDLYFINNSKIEPEDPNKYYKNTLLYPIAKSFLDNFPQYTDIIKTYEQTLDSIPDIISKDKVLDKFIAINNTTSINIKVWMDNVRIYPPDTIEAINNSNFGYVPTPNIAFAARNNYTAVIIADINYSYTIYDAPHDNTYVNRVKFAKTASEVGTTHTYKLPNSYVVNIPIPIGCKYCALRHYDMPTLIKSGEEMTNYYGFFIIEGYCKYILPLYRKPFNRPLIVKNDYEEQLSRAEAIYTKGYDYEESYYIVGAMVVPKNQSSKSVRSEKASAHKTSPPDFGFSLQLAHPKMNEEIKVNNKSTKKLFNFVPIKFLFVAFGCLTDSEMIKYICPQLDDYGLINAISSACLQGYKHREAIYNSSHINLPSNSNYIFYEKPLTEFDAKYIIGMIILSDKTKNEILSSIDEKKRENEFKIWVVQLVTEILNERFMPGIGAHIDGNVDRNTAVCVELGMIIKELYMIGNKLNPTQDKTSLTNRRVRHGQQLAREFKSFHGVRLREIFEAIKTTLSKRPDIKTINESLNSLMQTVSKQISNAQSTSLINAFKGTSNESKLSAEILQPKSQPFAWNSLRQIVIATEKKKNNSSSVSWEHRAVHQSELYFICPTQTPESQAGKFKTPAIFTYISLTGDEKSVIRIIQKYKTYIPSIKNISNVGEYYVVRVNGCVIGYAPQYEEIENLFKLLMISRRNNKIPIDCGITMNHILSRLDVWTDTGRLISPFVVLENAFTISAKDITKGEHIRLSGSIKIKPEFQEWLIRLRDDNKVYYEGFQKGFIEYMDPEMTIYNAVIAPCMKELYKNPHIYTHVALPNHIHGIIASIVPAINTNAGVRASYLTNHVKQQIGLVLSTPQLKYGSDLNILTSPQIPVVRPIVYDFMNIREFPIGQNVIVAFMAFKDNQEDAIILNRASVERGLLQIDSLSTFIVTDISPKDDEFKVPTGNITLNGNPDSYSKLDPSTALPKNIGDIFYTNDVIIGKVTKSSDGEVDSSLLNDRPDGRYPMSANLRPLRCVVKNKIHGESKTTKIALMGQFRVPIVGDKFNSEHAQKGTCGCILDPDEMPYNSTGIRPDIIFNAPAVFQRKTYGHMFVSVLAKIASLLGCPIDCTPYHTIRDVDDVRELFGKLGLDKAGYETLYDAETGRPYQSQIFMSNHYWGRQSHLVEMKLSVRNNGPRVLETGQPQKGRKHGGGLSIDKMTFDAHNSAGICELSRDIHLNQGSKIKIAICKRCKSPLGYYHAVEQRWMCSKCGPHQDIVIKDVPPAANLLNHIFNGLHLSMDYIDESTEPTIM